MKKNNKKIKKDVEKKKINLKKQKLKLNKKIIFIVIAIVFLFNIMNNIFKSKIIKNEKANIVIYDQNVTSELTQDIIIQDDIIYMSFEDIKKFIDKTIYYEEESNTIIMTSDKKLSSIKCGEEIITINGAEQKLYCTTLFKNDIIYLPISEFNNVYDIEIVYKANTNITTIDYLSEKMEKAYLKKTKNIKTEKSVFSKNIENVKKGNWIIYLSEEDGWAKIRTQNGNIGYIKRKHLDNFVTEREKLVDENIEEEGYKYDITKKDISNYSKREKLINEIWLKILNNNDTTVEIICNKEQEGIERFKIEIVPFLKESGINTIIN